jgi:hypothetical protein
MADPPRSFSDEVAKSLSKFSSGPADRQPRAVQAIEPGAEVAASAEGLNQMVPPPPVQEGPVEDEATARKRARRARAATVLARSINFKRTLVPVLLTTSVMMLITAATRFLAGEDSSFRIMPWWFTLTFLGFSVLMLLMGAFTMMQLKSQLAASEALAAQQSQQA